MKPLLEIAEFSFQQFSAMALFWFQAILTHSVDMYANEQIDQCRKLYLSGHKISDIAKQLTVARFSIYRWIRKYGWNDLQRVDGDPFEVAQRRLSALLIRDNKQDKQLAEIELLTGVIERLGKLEGLSERQQAGTTASGSKKRQKKRTGNDFTGIDHQRVMKQFKESQFAYQFALWPEVVQRIRMLLKSRQVGFTRYFSAEALVDAVINGKNQIFLSASRNQSDVFRNYIKGFCLEWFDKEVKGKDKIEIVTDKGLVNLHFLSNNAETAQSYNGNVYFDEFFWMRDFERLNKVAAAMASQKRFRRTYFSTPSAQSHPAYKLWTGEQFNQRFHGKDQVEPVFPDKKQLKQGAIGPDNVWRKIITLYDARKAGCDLFDIDQLKIEYTQEEFQQLFLCQFIDDSNSLFQLAMLEPCLGDLSDWRDFKPDIERPFASRPVWIGYDPSRTRDGATIVVIAPPKKLGGQFRVLERIRMHGQSWPVQAAVIKSLTEKYQVDYIGIDLTGPGSGVFDLVQQFYSRATPIHYTIESKTRLVLKAQEVISEGRILWDASWSDIAAGFMSIRRTTTSHGRITYVADRSERTGHADSAWAIMHALINEGLNYRNQRPSAYVFGGD